MSLSLQPKFVGLPLFGGVDSETDCHIEASMFQMVFLNVECVCAFERVGAATKDGVTCACLQDMQVHRSIGDGDKETDALHCAVQEANSTSVLRLSQAGYDAQHLQVTLIKKDNQQERVTEPNTVARQLALAKANDHGGHFHVTHGAHMTCNDLFNAAEFSARKEERGEEEKKKKIRSSASRC